MTWYITRHAQTRQTQAKLPYGNEMLTAEILQEHIQVIEKIGTYLKAKSISSLYSSEYLRCKQTAAILGRILEKDFIYDSRINEFNRIEFQDFKNHIQNFIQEIENKNPEGVLIVTHGGTIAGLVSLITWGEFRENELVMYPPPGVLITIENGKAEYRDFNES